MGSSVPERIVWAVDQVAAADRVLEIGCGAGHALALLRERMPRAEIVAIDRSALQVARARERAGVRVERMELDDAPEVLGAFDVVLAINVNAFWTAPSPSFASLARLLRPGGRALLVFEPPSASRLTAIREQLLTLLPAYGFAVDDVREAAFPCVCVVGRASPSHAPGGA